MIRTFEDAVKFLQSFIPEEKHAYPAEHGLARMNYLMNCLGDPQYTYETIHVSGTSGKGSTSTMIAAILQHTNTVGLHTSPHLVSVTERMKINGRDISSKKFLCVLHALLPAIEKVQKSAYGMPSYFEITTAMALYYFAKKKVDIAVIEVGLGGRLDGTNVVQPTASIVTNIGLDHTEVLGETIEKIAKEKAGIIKPGCVVVSGATQETVRDILQRTCLIKHVPLFLLNRDFVFRVQSVGLGGSVFDYQGAQTITNIRLGLMGKHQVENAAVAIKTVELFYARKKRPLDYISTRIKKALKKISISGRFEIVQKNPYIILDGAHNPDKIQAFVSTIQTLFPGQKGTLLFAVKKDKDALKMLQLLLPISSHIILTQYRSWIDTGYTTSVDPKELKKIIQRIHPLLKVVIIQDPIRAYTHSRKEATAKNLIFVTGSLYLVGQIYSFLKEH